MNATGNTLKTNARTALCYIRQSHTRDANDMDSPDRQKANIEAVCTQNGWIPEWYVDADGHKSGTKEVNRPAWLKLKKRLGDSDVIALVGNDLSRLHRKGWRIGDLLDMVEAFNVKLVLAAPGKQLDFSTIQGRLLALIVGIFDEYYAADIAARARDSIRHRKAKGVSVGTPPFATERDEDGKLVLLDEGAWLLADGTFSAGNANESPDESAKWRPYASAAKAILEIYSQNKHGYPTIASIMQQQGWAYRNNAKMPTQFEAEDVRRVVANWAEYGGFVFEGRARNRHPHDFDTTKIVLDAERSVFPIDLLYKVGNVHRERVVGHNSLIHGKKKNDYAYALNGLVYCAHCERSVAQFSDPTLRSRLAGIWHSKGANQSRYRHKSGVNCGSKNKSVKTAFLEGEFARLLNLLVVKPDQIDILKSLGLQANQLDIANDDSPDVEAQKVAAISRLHRQIDANVHLYKDGVLSRDEYLQRKDRLERELAAWEARTTETEKVAIELALCIEAINRMATLWASSADEERQDMAHHLFQYVTVDLDVQRIVDFRLKPWADRFITVRGALYEEEKGLEKTILVSQDQYTEVVPTGRRTYPRYFKLEFAFHKAKHTSQPRPIDPAKIELQAKAIELRSSGWSFPAIAKHLDISVGTAWNMAKLTN